MKKLEAVLGEATTPTTLVVGKTYPAKDGGSITPTEIQVDNFHLTPEAHVRYDWVDPEGKKGSGAGSASSIKKNYF